MQPNEEKCSFNKPSALTSFIFVAAHSIIRIEQQHLAMPKRKLRSESDSELVLCVDKNLLRRKICQLNTLCMVRFLNVT